MAAAVAVLIGSNAIAKETRSLSDFLSDCTRNSEACRENLHDYLLAAKTQGFICLPDDLSIDRAVSQELDWLRDHGNDDAALDNGNAEDAQWAAITTLWPCKKD
ncbi:MAG: hypothetical protein KJS68_03375 [Alphaproteobacteria bacterium]|nr:hypothetical protein [Alphaproteobacteria bacterium]MDE2492993.1 hypothetical protein [Alphaproteobacteria bacterium]